MRNYEDVFLEVLRIEREAHERVLQKIAARQLGEAWIGISDDRRAEVRDEPDRRMGSSDTAPSTDAPTCIPDDRDREAA
jgi:hypothetical protein